jgi:hypothetical protein
MVVGCSASIAAAQSPPTVPAAVLVDAAAEDPDNADIIVVGESGGEASLTADSLRDAAQAFTRHREEFAPQAQFQFSVEPIAGVALSSIAIRLRSNRRNAEGGYDRIELPIDEQGRITLPAETVMTGNWSLRTSARAGTLRIRPIILSPGSTRFDRRFGDARLQCRVAIAFARMGLLARAALGTVGACSSRRVATYLGTPQPIEAVSIEGWTQPITVRDDRMSFRVPLNEASIPNEARMRITFR